MEHEEIIRYLDALERESSFRVDAELKSSSTETTQRVFLKSGSGQESGPYIRKFIRRDTGLGSAYERIWKACQAGSRFEHIPHVFEYYLHDDMTVVVMEHINGPTLQDIVYETDPSVELAARLFPGLCDAVSELHGQFDPPIIHRDLKPSNVVLRNGVPVIIDFGIARDYDDDASTDTVYFGTRAYAPPEQFGYRQTTVRSDVYTLGLLLYFLLVERTPTPQAAQAGYADVLIPEPLRQVVARAAAFDPQDRYASAQELKEAFGKALLQTSPAAGPTPAAAAQEPSPTPSAPSTLVGTVPTVHVQATIDADVPADAAPELYAAASQTPGPVAAQWSVPLDMNAVRQPMPLATPTSTEVQPIWPDTDPRPAPSMLNVRNVIVGTFYVLFVAVSLWMGIDPTNGSTTARYPFIYNAFAYLVYMPIVLTVIAYFALDKRWLRERVAFFRAIAGGKEKLLAFIIIFLGGMVLTSLGKATGMV